LSFERQQRGQQGDGICLFNDFLNFFFEAFEGVLVLFGDPDYFLFFFVIFVWGDLEGFRELFLVKSCIRCEQLGGRVLKRYEMHND
jgi:hypothetical protein